MSRPVKSEPDKYSCPVRSYLKPRTYKKLLKYCNDMRLPTISSAARRILEIVDSYPEERLLGLLQTDTIETPSLQGREH